MPKKFKCCPWCGHSLDVTLCPVLNTPCNRAIKEDGVVKCSSGKESKVSHGVCGWLDMQS